MFLEKFEVFPINMKTLLMTVTKSVLSLFLVKLQASTRNVNQRDRDWFVYSKILGCQ